MFLLQGLLLLAMCQEWKADGHVKTPVLVCTFVITALYSFGCALFQDVDQRKKEK